MSGARYAVYFAPELDSAWWRFGAGWLGRDEKRNAPLPQPVPVPAGLGAAAFAEATAEPRRYGFHATLKAPFHLRAATTESVLRSRLDALASELRALQLPPLRPALIEAFVALVPSASSPAVDALAARCVLAFDDLRAPPTAQELARRRPEQLDDLGRALLERHGYPHVLERFRFHMTLTGPLERNIAEGLVTAVEPAVNRLNREAPLRLDRLCLFKQEAEGTPFLRLHDSELRS